MIYETKLYNLRCDGCNDSFLLRGNKVSMFYVSDLMEAAKEEGWIQDNGLDFCPNCQKIRDKK